MSVEQPTLPGGKGAKASCDSRPRLTAERRNTHQRTMPMDAVLQILERREPAPHQLIEVLLDIQDECGHIPQAAMILVAEHLKLPLIEVFRVASFYKAFALTPRGRHIITVCVGTACHVRGSPRMLDEVLGFLGLEPGQTTEDGLFTVECVNCLGCCALGPVIVLDGEYHDHMTPAKLRKLIQSVREAEKEVLTHAEAGVRC